MFKYYPRNKKNFRTCSEQPYSFSNLSPKEIFEESQRIEIDLIPFRASTRKDAIIRVDHREPKELVPKLMQTGLDVHSCSLSDGDIIISSRSDANRALLIERKTITDLYTGIVGQNHHCHEQAERYYALSQTAAAEGRFLQVLWIVEGQDEGSRLLYNCLPKPKQMDGWQNYIQVILSQFMVQSYSLHHTAALIARFTQGFIEQSLYYSVKIGSLKVDRSKAERKQLKAAMPSASERQDHGIRMAQHGLEELLMLFPGINSAVAKEMAKTGLTLAELTNLSLEELRNIRGIGPKSAEAIYSVFNQKG